MEFDTEWDKTYSVVLGLSLLEGAALLPLAPRRRPPRTGVLAPFKRLFKASTFFEMSSASWPGSISLEGAGKNDRELENIVNGLLYLWRTYS